MNDTGTGPAREQPVRIEMVRKVASSLRERNDLERRLVNLTGVPVQRQTLASWIAAEVLGVRFVDDGAVRAGAGVLPDEAWCAGFGPEVLVRWSVPGAQAAAGDRDQADDGCGRRGACLLDLCAGGSAGGSAAGGAWTIDRLDLVAPSPDGRVPRARCVYVTDGRDSLLSSDQVAALRLLSATAVPALTRYH